MTVGFTFDQAKCTGCQACILACTIENGLAFDHSWRTVHTFNERHYPHLSVEHLSLACNHCEDPACLRACPANVYSRNADTGFVQLDEAKCIGCRYCIWACPFGAPRFDSTKGVIGKCTFCADRQAGGKSPACVELCPTGALGLGSIGRQDLRPVVAGFPHTKLKPAISVAPAAERRSPPNTSTAAPNRPFVPGREQRELLPALRDEWPLAAFTFLVPVLVGLLATSVFAEHPPALGFFLGVSTLATVSSFSHLGRKKRAWRAVLHLQSSWLSREIVLFGVMIGTGAGYLTFAPDNRPLGWVVFAIGFATLISVDRVYATLPQIDGQQYHSASATLTGLFLVGIFAANPLVAGTIGAGKLVLYVQRKIGFGKKDKPVRFALSAVRIAGGFLVPVIVWFFSSGHVSALVIVAILFGELIDRLEFYAELDIVTPEKQMTIDLLKATAS